ncbi:unnamed protein product [Bursaphelenchus okinawaensis]|uniref:Metallo-beta-lactamase domain-containing protein n=1 Tax=Bursaphelenchus okinawaensis TaxID=465554 RepID=A0A811KMB5_9BILA|nr:unnamed protein product [Bursaphelenchus okinawaensis]CAG9106583.1 unnamed protein product [Bursaphelenchus okinawaensis]
MFLQAVRSTFNQVRSMKIVAETALADNYMYYVIDDRTRKGFVVDLGDVSKVSEVERREEFTLTAAFVTHHHWDHAQGAPDLRKQYPDIKIYAGDPDRIHLTKAVKDNDVIEFGQLEIRVIGTPGHTTSHVCYYVQDTMTGKKALFTGDTIFLAGCGKFFECPGSVMYDTIYNKLMNIVADDTDMYFGHEYSLTNLKFAKEVEPMNARVSEKYDNVKTQLNSGKYSTPSLWGDEKLYNPFLRVNETSVKEYCQAEDPVQVLDKLRSKKNNFRG